jgi:hypothetical protein
VTVTATGPGTADEDETLHACAGITHRWRLTEQIERAPSAELDQLRERVTEVGDVR